MDGLTRLNAAGLSNSAVFGAKGHEEMVSAADQMKAVHKARLNRQALADPSMIARLVALAASPVYNASADLIQAVASSNSFTA